MVIRVKVLFESRKAPIDRRALSIRTKESIQGVMVMALLTKEGTQVMVIGG